MKDSSAVTPAYETPSRCLGRLNWGFIEQSLNTQGFVVLPDLIPPAQARMMAGLYSDDTLFRARINMESHGFGRGEYKYFRYPLPPEIQDLRTRLYRYLAPIANRWHAAMGLPARFPLEHTEFIQRCHDAGQMRPTPLLLNYGSDDYNCLHQDLYGEHVFPLQATILLSQPGEDFEGGEFVMTKQMPRRQSQALVAPLGFGDTIVFAVNFLPVPGKRGVTRAALRHGVSRVTAGHRQTLGIIFHDAR